jgi:phosphoserine phosphatase RsbU/P
MPTSTSGSSVPPPGIRLQIVAGAAAPNRVALGRERATIGRSPRADLTLDDPFASRLHAELRTQGTACWVSDLGSVNGTFLNEVPVTSPVQVFPGDRIRIGETEMILEEAQAAERSAAVSEHSAPITRPVVLPGDGPSTGELAAVLATVERAGGATLGPLPRAEGRDLFSVVSKVGVALLSSTSLDEVLGKILALVFDGIPAERAFLLLAEREGEPPRLRAANYRDPESFVGPEEVEISRSIVKEVIEDGRSVLSTDVQRDERFRTRDSVILSGVRSVMAVPMTVGGKPLGLVYVDSPLEVRPFGNEDLQVLTTIASVAAVKLENALLLEQRLEHERLKGEIQRAREIQLRLLPSQPPELPGYDLAGVSFPCYEVGGDYFDFIPSPDGGLLLTVGDVSGKGLDAALLMSSMQAAIRSRMAGASGMDELMQGVNAYLCATFPFNKFATLFCALVAPDDGNIVYANAGHTPPLILRRDGSLEELSATGLPVGLEEEERYPTQRLRLETGDLMVAFSDGIAETADSEGEMIETERLAEIIRGVGDHSAGEILDRIDAALVERMEGAEASDDMTLVVLKKL